MVVVPTNDREIPGSTPGRYYLQIKITSKSWSGEPETPSLVETFHPFFYLFPHRPPTLRASLVCPLLDWLHHSRWSYRSVHPLVTPSFWMVVQIWSRRSVLRVVPRLLTTPGQTWWIPYRTYFIRKDSGCWCNLNLQITSPGGRTRDFTVVGRYNYGYAVKTFIKLDESLHGVTVVIVIPTTLGRRFEVVH